MANRDLIKVLNQSATDPNDPKREQAKKLLRLLEAFLDDETEASAEEDAEDATRPKGSPPAARAKALVNTPKVTNLSPYAAQLDREMGLTPARPTISVAGNELRMSSVSQRVIK